MYIKVKATPGAKKELFEKEKEGYFKISVKERAQKNMANRRIIELVARHFKVPLGKVRIVNGHRSPSKLLFIEGESI